MNECYLDYYCCGPYSTVTPEIEKIMADMGWTWKHYDDEVKPTHQIIAPKSIDSDEEFGEF